MSDSRWDMTYLGMQVLIEGLAVEACYENSQNMREFRQRLFTRIVPTIKDIGLWGPKIRKGYGEMGILEYGEIDVNALSAADEATARHFDAARS